MFVLPVLFLFIYCFACFSVFSVSNYSAWNLSPEWQAVFCRSSGRCCSTVLPCWAAHTCCRSSPSTCSPYTITTAEVKLHIFKHAPLLLSLHNKYCFRALTWFCFGFIFIHINTMSWLWINFLLIKPCLCLAGEEGEVRSVLHEQSTALGLGMFALLVQRCTELLRETPAGTHTVTSTGSCCLCVYESCGSPFISTSGRYRVNT